MLFWMYDALLVASLPLLIPFFKARALFKNKRAPSTFFHLPKISLEKPVIWIHAVSLGEINTAKPFIEGLKKKHPNYKIVISCVTETGLSSAKLINDVFAFYLPLDLSILQNGLVKQISPKLFLYIEGDVWPNLNRALKKHNVPVCIVSAKLSEKTKLRLNRFPKISSILYHTLSQIFCQDSLMQDRFLEVGCNQDRVKITGNLKLSQSQMPKIKNSKIDSFLKLDPSKKTIMIASTHIHEETLILKALGSFVDSYNIILAPRHPQRFEEVKRDLKNLGICFSSFTENENPQGIFLMDAIGNLKECYSYADLTILGGSFIKGIGGHNVMEPLFQKCPVIVGPYAYSQKSLVEKMCEYKLGDISHLERLREDIERLISQERNQQYFSLLESESQRVLDESLNACSTFLN